MQKKKYALVRNERELAWLKRQSKDEWQRLEAKRDGLVQKTRYIFVIDILQGAMRGTYFKVRKFQRIGNQLELVMKKYYKRVGE